MTRAAARDLFDVNNMIARNLFDTDELTLLRKIAVFYAAVGGKVQIDRFDFSNIRTITEDKVRKTLNPVLKKGAYFMTAEAQERADAFLSALMSLPENELEFLTRFYNREFCPELLFDDPATADRLRQHPMVIWRTQPETLRVR
jgi:hypothetical protein